jgi:excisionase family DNA binding protein
VSELEQPAVPRLGLSVAEAAESLGISRDSFDRYVLADLRIVRVGRRYVIPTEELARYLRERGAVLLESERQR